MQLSAEERRSLFAIYQDQHGYTAVVHHFGLLRRVDLCHASGEAVSAAMREDGAVESSDGYDDDPTAKIHFLFPNQYASLLTDDEQTAVAEAIRQMWYDKYGHLLRQQVRSNRGSMNVMNRIAHKQRRNHARGH